jgi:Icc-related predicted phosphoesterase
VKIIAISDLHGDLPKPEDLPSGDVLIIAGDILPDDYIAEAGSVGTTRVMRQGLWFDSILVPWLRVVKSRYKKVLWTGGNHDFFLQSMISHSIRAVMPEGVHYMVEEDLTIDGVKFFLAPWNTTKGWAFCLDEEDHYRRLAQLPGDIDVMVTHGPPYTAGFNGQLEYFTSPALSHYIRENQKTLKAWICGHIHEAYGVYRMWDVPVYVVSSKDRDYRSVNPPVIIEVEGGDSPVRTHPD